MNMINTKIYLNIIVCMLALFAAACAPTPRVDAAFGDAVTSTIEAQLYDPAAAANPSPDVVEGTDGQRMEAVMEAHRSQSGSDGQAGSGSQTGSGGMPLSISVN
jgi:hypothetical protein